MIELFYFGEQLGSGLKSIVLNDGLQKKINIMKNREFNFYN